ncbi:MAG TPA: carboxypeptidase-like regulatory domain-containing protein [Candidatus Acidoferrales bacterium]|nr:carboxypeptidase-like regulatory domain-containing protein [Candidatus Acidoferrales bacterium]
MKLILPLLASSGILLAQQTQQPVAPQDKCAIAGKVVNLVTGQPVRKARLILTVVNTVVNPQGGAQRRAGQPAPQPPPPAVVTSGADGTFVFADLDPGIYRLAGRHDNYSNQQYGAKKPGQVGEKIVLAPGAKMTGVEMKLTPYATVSGRIRDEDGDPMQQVPVAVMVYQYTNSGRQLTERGTANSNDLGEYRIFDLAPGKYYLRVSPPPMRGLRSGGGDAEDSFIAVYYPNSGDPSGASPLDLSPGQQLGSVDFTLRRAHAATISGHIVKPTGGGSLSIGLTYVTNGGTSSYSTSNGVNNADGKFEMRGITPGAYFLNGYCNVGDRRFTANIPIQVATTDIENLEVRLAPPVDVAGRVRIEGETQIKLTQVRVSLDGKARSGGNGGSVMEDGAFGFRGLEPDVYHVTVNAPGELYLKSISWDTRDVTESGIDLSSGAPNAALEVVVSANGGQIDGSVENDKSEPAANAMVTLVPPGARRTRTFFKNVPTGADGHFTITGVAPGSYKLYAWEDVEINAVLYDPDFLRPFESAGENIQIADGSKHAAKLKLIPKPVE